MVPIIMEIDRSRAMDKLFFDEGIEIEDIGKTIRANKVNETPEFQKMTAECQEKMRAAQQTWGH